VDGKKALAATAAQRNTVTGFVDAYAKSQPDPDFYQVLDVARRIAGTGSLGVDRYVILVTGKGSPNGNYLLDLKRALPSSLAPHLKLAQPAWKTEALRIVTLQRRLQAVSMARLYPVLVGEAPYVLRALQPSEDRITLTRSARTPGELEQLAGSMGQIVAWAQLRSAGREGSAIADELVDFGKRKKWQEQLRLAAHDSAAQVRKDAATYDAAFDAGAFNE
jgi:uncharacterized protein (DUF2252 family)